MEPFQIFYERFTPPAQALEKYKDDPDAMVTFTSQFIPYGGTGRGEKEANKLSNRLGMNPHTEYDTPVGIYSYPIQAYWDHLKNWGGIHFAKEKPILWVFKPRDSKRCPRTSQYTEDDYAKDKEELVEIFSNYDFKGLEAGIYGEYQNPPLKHFWSLTRALANRISIKYSNVKHIAVWTQIMRRFYDGIIDDAGSGTIHSAEPTQAVFWNSSYIDPVEKIDRTYGGRYSSREYNDEDFWNHGPNANLIKKESVQKMVFDNLLRGTPEKIPSGIYEKLKESDLWDSIQRAMAGNSTFVHAMYSLNDWRGVFKYLFSLWFKHQTPDTPPFLDGDMYSLIPPEITIDYPLEILNLLKEAPDSIKGLVVIILEKHPPTDSNLGIYEKILSLMTSADRETKFEILQVLLTKIPTDIIIGHDNILNSLLDLFGNLNHRTYTYLDDYQWLHVGEKLIKLIYKKNRHSNKWVQLYPAFSNLQQDAVSRARLLELFLQKCTDTSYVDGLRDYLEKETDISVLGQGINDVFERHYGVRPFEKVPDEPTMRKARHFKRGDYVKCINLYNDENGNTVYTGENLIVYGYKTTNGEDVPKGFVTVLDHYGVATVAPGKYFKLFPDIVDRTKEYFTSDATVARLMGFPPPKMTQSETLEATTEDSYETFVKGEIVRIIFDTRAEYHTDYTISPDEYYAVEDLTGETTTRVIISVGTNKHGVYIAKKDCEKVKLDYGLKDIVEDVEGNVYLTLYVHPDGKLDVYPFQGEKKSITLSSIFDVMKYDYTNPSSGKATQVPATPENLKIGDEIICIDSDDQYLHIGETYIATGFSSGYDGAPMVKMKIGSFFKTFYMWRFAKVVNSDDNIDYKVGDRIKVIGFEYYNGETGTIAEILPDSSFPFNVILDSDKTYRVAFTKKQIEPYDDSLDSPKQNNTPWKVGDKVKYKKGWLEGEYYKGKVTKVKENGAVVIDWAEFGLQEFEPPLAPELEHDDDKDPEPTTPNPPPQKNNGDWEIGDRVKLENSIDGGFWYGEIIQVLDYGSIKIKWDDGSSSIEVPNDPDLLPDVKI